MCLNPIVVRNRSKYVSLHGSYLFYNVPCGYCEECQQDRINGIQARLTQEYNDSVVTYVDTLTYSNEMLPLVTPDMRIERAKQSYDESKLYSRGIPCFNYADITAFLKRLHINLVRDGYYIIEHRCGFGVDGPIERDVKVCPVKHFISSEYGGQFHRPHYHLILFSSIYISPDVLHYHVARAWQDFGITDLYKKSPDGSVSAKLPQDKLVSGVGAIAYVAKYAVKDDDYTEFLLNCFKKLYDYQIYVDNTSVKSIRKQFRELFAKNPLVAKNIYPHTLQSNFLGLGLCNKHNPDYVTLFETGLLNVRDKRGDIVNTIKAPSYVIRKLFFNDFKDFDGTHHWELNNDGLSYSQNRCNLKVDFLFHKYFDIYQRPQYYDDKCVDDSLLRLSIDELLDGRSLYDFAVYKAFYQGRLFSDIDECFNDHDIYSLNLIDKQIFTKDLRSKENRFDFSFDGFVRMLYDPTKYKDVFPANLYDYLLSISCSSLSLSVRYSDFLNFLSHFFVVNENSHYLFRYFDKLSNLFDTYLNARNEQLIEFYKVKKKEKDIAKMSNPIFLQHECNNQIHRDNISRQIISQF